MRCSPTLGSVDAVWHLGDVVGYGPDPDGVVARLAGDRRGRRRRQPRRGGGRRPRDRLVQPGRAGGDGVDPRRASRRRPRDWLAGAARAPRRRPTFSLVHGSPRDPIWEYIVTSPVARANLGRPDDPVGLYGHTHLPMVWSASEDGAVEPSSPAGVDVRLDGRRGARSTRAASASRATATRGRAGWSSTRTRGRAPGTGSPTTSRPSRRRCATPACRSAWSSASATASDAWRRRDRRPAAAPGPQARRPARPRRAAARRPTSAGPARAS